MAEEIHFIGEVMSVYFENPSNLYKVLRVKVIEADDSQLLAEEITVTGQFAALHLDTQYEFFGQFTNHPRYGEQIAVTRYGQITPTSEAGVIDFLASYRFVGIGKKLAERIVTTLGSEAIERILADPDCLKQVRGLTPEKRRSLVETLREHHGTERLFLRLSEWGFGPRLADKIYSALGDQAIQLIEQNPYLLVEKVEGIGFFKADVLAEQLGIEADATSRLVAGLYATVSDLCNRNGDTYVEQTALITGTRQLLERSRPFMLEPAQLEQALETALLNKQLCQLDQGIMLPSLYFAETGAVKLMTDFIEYEQIERFAPDEIEIKLAEVSRVTGIDYDETQRQAMCLALQSPLSIITGGPGTGKTTLIRGILTLHQLLHQYDADSVHNRFETGPVLLAAPTGRAAKRMQETTGIPATTIHRLIGYTRESTVDGFDPTTLEGKLLIVDEMSMVDTWLMHWLWQAIPYGMQVILVGDKDQLPSVGPGKVFSDLIEARVLPTISLTKIYRQAQDSSIVQLAHTIRQGHLPQDFQQKQEDRAFIPCSTNQVAHVIQQVVSQAQKKGFDETNLQVLAPMYKGSAGITFLNQMLQDLLNPASRRKQQIEYFDQVFRQGDKVLQLVNNADEGVYNGDIGRIVAVVPKLQSESGNDEVVVEFDEGKELVYRRGDMDQLTLAYCCSVHKSQGSEYPLVILPLVESYSRMLRKDLVYTAVTRASKSLVLVGNYRSFELAVQQQDNQRKTNLRDLLQVALGTTTLAQASEAIIKEKRARQMTQVEVSSASQVQDERNDAVLIGRPSSISNHDVLPNGKLEPQGQLALVTELIDQIDPMIGMAGISPYDFMPES